MIEKPDKLTCPRCGYDYYYTGRFIGLRHLEIEDLAELDKTLSIADDDGHWYPPKTAEIHESIKAELARRAESKEGGG